ncbi:MAG: transposase [Sphingobacteriales bacterium]|nr:MAG: transposase [Sphingobacteriales bacterium]
MKPQFKAIPANKLSLFPENIFDKIPANHPVMLVNELVDGLDIDHIIKQYKGGGTTSYHPRMMLKVLFYAYLNNIYSCRKIEKALHENIHFMWLSGE